MQVVLPWLGAPEPMILAALGTILFVPLIRRFAGAAGLRLTGAALGLGLVMAGWYLFGARLITPRLLFERLPVLVAFGLAVGVLLDLFRAPRLVQWLAAALAALATGWWLVGAPMEFPDPLAFAGRMALPVAIAAVALAGLLRPQPEPAGQSAMLLAAALGLAAAAVLAGLPAPTLAFAASLAAGAAAFFVLQLLFPAVTLGAAGAFPAALALAGSAIAMWIATRASGLAFAFPVLACVFLAAPMAQRIAPRGKVARRVMAPLLWLGAGLLPALAAAFLAWAIGA